MNILELSEQEIIRRQSLEALKENHIDPYPAAEFTVTLNRKRLSKIFRKMPLSVQ